MKLVYMLPPRMRHQTWSISTEMQERHIEVATGIVITSNIWSKEVMLEARASGMRL